MKFNSQTWKRFFHNGRTALHALGVGAGLCAALLGTLVLMGAGRISAQETKQATVVVQFDNHSQAVRDVRFSDTISGLRALQLSGLAVITTMTGFGPAVCSIEGVGCPADDCFCGGNKFWGYSYWGDGAWQSYPVGAGSSVISQTGAAEGWRWGEFGAPQQPLSVTQAAFDGLTWLHARHAANTGGQGSVGASLETMFAIGANLLSAAEWNAGAPSLSDFIAVNGAGYTRQTAAGAGKMLAALAAADSCLPVGSMTPMGHYSPTLGAYSNQSGANSWAILGAYAISEVVPSNAVAYLGAQAQPDGGWEWAPGWGSDTNTTALALQALVAAGKPISSSQIVSGLAFLKSAQQPDGGFAYDASPGGVSDVNSTAYVVQALIAAGEDPAGANWTVGGETPLDFILARQQPDDSFEWQAGTGSNQLATQQAIPALLGRPHPIQKRSLESCPGVYLPIVAAQ